MQAIPHTLTNVDISAWALMTGRNPSAFDLSVLVQLEQTFWRVHHSGGADDKPQSLIKQFAVIAEPKKPLRKVNLGK